MEEEQSISDSNEKALLLCPNCYKNIPETSIEELNGQVKLKLRCSCKGEELLLDIGEYLLKMAKQPPVGNDNCTLHSLKGERFCIECSIWLCQECLKAHNKHLHLKTALAVKCMEHMKKYAFYCTQCNSSLCNDCQCNHLNHSLLPISSLDPSLINSHYQSAFDAIFSKNKNFPDKLIQRIQNEMDELIDKLSKLNAMKQEILSLLKANTSINESFKELYHLYYNTALTLKDYPNYQLLQLGASMKINTPLINIKEQSLEKDYLVVKQYLQSNYAFKLNELHYHCMQTLTQHSNAIRCLIELIDERLASCSDDKTIKIWNASLTECQAVLTGHSSYIYSIIELTNDKLASCSDDKTIKIFNLASLTCSGMLSGHTGAIWSLVKVADDRIASCSDDKTIKIWSIASLTCEGTLLGHTSFINCLILLKDGQLTSGSYDKSIKFWNMTALNCKGTLNGHSNAVRNLLQLQDNRLVSCSDDKSIRIWALSPKAECVFTLTGHSNKVYSVIPFNSESIASASSDSSIKIWSLSSNKCIATLTGHSSFVWCLLLLKDGRLASGSGDKTIKLWKV